MVEKRVQLQFQVRKTFFSLAFCECCRRLLFQGEPSNFSYQQKRERSGFQLLLVRFLLPHLRIQIPPEMRAQGPKTLSAGGWMKSETRMQHCIDMRHCIALHWNIATLRQVRMQKILAAAMLAGETGMAESMVGIIMPGSSRLDQVRLIFAKSHSIFHIHCKWGLWRISPAFWFFLLWRTPEVRTEVQALSSPPPDHPKSQLGGFIISSFGCMHCVTLLSTCGLLSQQRDVGTFQQAMQVALGCILYQFALNYVELCWD